MSDPSLPPQARTSIDEAGVLTQRRASVNRLLIGVGVVLLLALGAVVFADGTTRERLGQVITNGGLPTLEPAVAVVIIPTATPAIGSGDPATDPTAAIAQTQTAIAIMLNATAEAVAIPTRTAVAATSIALLDATAVVAQATATQIASQFTPVFVEPFDDNRNNWYEGLFGEIEIDRIANGRFEVEWLGQGTSFEVYELQDFTDQQAEVTCYVADLGTDASCSLIIAYDPNIGYLKFETFGTSFRLLQLITSAPEGVSADDIAALRTAEAIVLAQGRYPLGLTSRRDDGGIRLAMVRSGPNVSLWANGIPLTRLRLPSLQAGKTGVSTDSYLPEGGITITFDDFTIATRP